jgi:dihydrofolate synthase/folylpolyglutamate synthase
MVRLVPRLEYAIDKLDPTLGQCITFEVKTALAFLYFAQAGVTHAVIEVGLGGRLCPTNVVEPYVSVITSISYDHMHFLGTTIAQIAYEKAGIIKRGVPTVCTSQDPQALRVFERVCAERNSNLVKVGPVGAPGCSYEYRVRNVGPDSQTIDVLTPSGAYDNLVLSLLGEHQCENATAAVAAVDQLRSRGLSIDAESVRAGLLAAHWPARLHLVARTPMIVVDGAHNSDSFTKLFRALYRHFEFGRLILVVGVMADKDLRGIITEIKAGGPDHVYVTAVEHPRAVAASALGALLSADLPPTKIHVSHDVASALSEAIANAGARDLVCITGSLYLSGEALRWLAKQPFCLPGSIEIEGQDLIL